MGNEFLSLACSELKVVAFLSFTDAGSAFVYGYLVTGQVFKLSALNESSVAYGVAKDINESGATNFMLFFKVFSTVYFFSFVASILFHLGAMQWMVAKLGRVLQV